MKLETLAKRLARKTNTPELEPIILGLADVKTLPMNCMIWTGAKLCATPRKNFRVSESARDGLLFDVVQEERPYGVINWQGKRISTHRLIFQLIMKPDYEFRMWSNCQVPLCVNPLHYRVDQKENSDPIPDQTIIMGTSDEEPWTLEEVEEIVEILLTDNSPKNWKDVISNPMIKEDGVPHDLLRRALNNLNKGYLT